MSFPDPTWMEDANCVGIPVDMFFPADGDSGAAKAAKRVCADCAPLLKCLEYAIVTKSDHGIYGGMTPRSRAEFRRAATRRVVTA